MKNINCHNLTKFLGLTEHDSGLYSVTEFCSRGDLRVSRNVHGFSFFFYNIKFLLKQPDIRCCSEINISKCGSTLQKKIHKYKWCNKLTFINIHFQDILSNEAFVLNREFSISLIRDIIQVM